MGKVSDPFATVSAPAAGVKAAQRSERRVRRLPLLAMLWSFAGVGAGHAVLGLPGWFTVWVGIRLGGTVLLSVLAACMPSAALYLLALSAAWGWIVCVPAGLHARARARAGKVGKTWPLAGPLVSVIVLCLVIFTNRGVEAYILGLYAIPSTSMVPALRTGDHVVAARGLLRPPLTHGQIVVFPSPADPKMTYIKRVVGLEGDEIRFEDDLLLRNGERISSGPTGEAAYFDNCEARGGIVHNEDGYEVLVDPDFRSPLASTGTFTVPAGQVFVAGDNRDHSGDSRAEHVGMVPVDAIVGTATSVWFSTTPCPRGELRWARMGRPL